MPLDEMAIGLGDNLLPPVVIEEGELLRYVDLLHCVFLSIVGRLDVKRRPAPLPPVRPMWLLKRQRGERDSRRSPRRLGCRMYPDRARPVAGASPSFRNTRQLSHGRKAIRPMAGSPGLLRHTRF